ncbi:MAG: DNA replication/repair protein RecF [Chlorobiales bacterium]|nr:DNA replication/repair protein RecF [Chlorobiales bacterium]
MRLQEIKLVNFRKHPELTFAPSDGINLLYGPNGSGKTNILEAVHYCALAKGLNKSLDRECLTFETNYFLLRSRFVDETGVEVFVKVSYEKASDKRIHVNSEELKKYSGLIGRIPCITFSPVEMSIINGSPQERRRFTDNALSQTNKRYLEDLLQYRRVLQQRNALLAESADRGTESGSLGVWTEKLSMLAGSIISSRLEFFDRLLVHLEQIYKEIGLGEVPGFIYMPSFGKLLSKTSDEDISRIMMQRLGEIGSREIYRRQTLLGPHRDDIVFRINDVEIKKYASQGQIRTFLIALKLALQRFVREFTGEPPIFLLDDLFSELDRKRVGKVLQLLEGAGQSIITATETQDIEGVHCIAVSELA